MYKKSIIVIFLFWSLIVNAQYNFSSYNAHNSIIQSINTSNNIIQARTKYFEKKLEEKPLLYLREKNHISKLNHISNSVSNWIKKIKLEADTERVLYDLLDQDFLKNIIFSNDGQLTLKGEKLKIKLDSLHLVNKQINLRGYTHLKDFTSEHFKTDSDFFDEEGNKVDYFNYLFYDKSNYGILMSLNILLLDVKTNQLLFYGTVMHY